MLGRWFVRKKDFEELRRRVEAIEKRQHTLERLEKAFVLAYPELKKARSTLICDDIIGELNKL